MIYSRAEEDLIILDSLEALTAKTKALALADGEVNFDENGKKLIKSLDERVYNKVKSDFCDGEYRHKALDALSQKGVVCLTVRSEGYPDGLKGIPEPPLVLYCRGNLSLLGGRCVGVVGSRRTPPNMLKACGEIAGELAKKFTVVSGLADGADSAAVGGALKSGRVISVLAYGFDYCYPAMNQQLVERVAERGLVISEYPPDTQPRKHLFPQRNRIIAALSDGVLVVSAGRKSGALITAGYAHEYGKKVFAFPYGLGAAAGEGCNALIKGGAHLAENAADIYSAFGVEYGAEKEIRLSEDETRALEIIREEGEVFAPVIAQKMGKQPYQIIATLSSLEIKRLIARLGGNRYAAL